MGENSEESIESDSENLNRYVGYMEEGGYYGAKLNRRPGLHDGTNVVTLLSVNFARTGIRRAQHYAFPPSPVTLRES